MPGGGESVAGDLAKPDDWPHRARRRVDWRGLFKGAKRGGTGNEVPAANCPGENQRQSAGRLPVAGGVRLPAAPRIVAGNEAVGAACAAVGGSLSPRRACHENRSLEHRHPGARPDPPRPGARHAEPVCPGCPRPRQRRSRLRDVSGGRVKKLSPSRARAPVSGTGRWRRPSRSRPDFPCIFGVPLRKCKDDFPPNLSKSR